MKKDPRFQMISLTPQVNSARVVDDETFNQKRFIEMIKACPECPKTTYPSSETFKTAFAKADAGAMFVITLSGHLSGGYNSTAVAKKPYEKETAEKGMTEQVEKVAVIDSLSASSGELSIALFTQNLYDSRLGFDEVVEKTLAYGDGMDTYFVLGSLGTFCKNGRLSGLQAFSATVLNIRPIIGTDMRTIIKLDQARGMNKALHKVCDITVKEMIDAASKIVVICRASNPERAEYVKNELVKRVGFKKIAVTNAAGVATVCVNDGGIILTV